MKKFVTFLITGLVALSSYAEIGTLSYGYAGEEVMPYGKNTKQTYDVAMCISDPALTGKKITGIKAYLNIVEGADSSALWMTKELKLDGKANTPDIMSRPVEIAGGQYVNYSCGVLSCELSEPYELTGEPVYIGYSVTVSEVKTPEQKNPILISPVINQEGFFIHATKSVLQWQNNVDKAGGVAVIFVELEGDYPEAALGIREIKDSKAEKDKPFSVPLIVSNLGTSEAKNVDYTYTVNGISRSAFCELEYPVMSSLTGEFTINLPCEGVDQVGNFDLTITIDKVNGIENTSEIPTATGKVQVYAYFPKNIPLVEEYTGTWCGWCPRGFVAMELVGEIYGDDAVVICYHNGDPMTVTDIYPMDVQGFPKGSVNRIELIDPYYGTSDEEFGISGDIDSVINSVTEGSIEILSAGLDDNLIHVTSKALFTIGMDEADYQIGYVLVANALTGEGAKWAQQNLYSTYAGQLDGTYLEEITYWPDIVPGLIYNDVAVDVKAMNGIKGSVPSQIACEEDIFNEYTFDISENTVIQNKENLVVTAYIINKKTGRIVNSHKLKVGEYNNVDSLDYSDSLVTSVEFYDLNGRLISNPEKGIYVKCERMNNGKFRTSKVLIK